MGQSARVESIDALKHFRVVLWKFAESANVALADAESELQRTLSWLENEQLAHWQTQLRKRTELVARAKEAVRMKKLFKNAAGGRDSVVDEEKALAIALRNLQEAEQKFASTKQWARKMQKEILLYKGQVQRFSTAVQADIPVAAAKLDAMVIALEAYVGLGAEGEAAANMSGNVAPVVETPAEEKQDESEKKVESND